jgi:hypothetical protein
MSYSKRQYITAALEELGLASYVFDASPEQLQSALRRLDALMPEWNGMGIRLGYPLPGSPDDSDIDEETGVPDWANDAIICNLACRIAPSYGKQTLPATMASANRGLNAILSRFAGPIEKQLPAGMPVGAGNKNADPFTEAPADPLQTGPDGPFEFY